MIRIVEGPVKLALTGQAEEISRLATRLKVRPEGYEYAPSYQAYVNTDGQDGWDGFISPIRIIEEGQGDRPTVADCLRGHKDKILGLAKRYKIPVDTSRCLESPFKTLMPDDVPKDIVAADFELDSYQRESVAHWLRHGMGVNKIAVNGGKTCMFAAASAMVKRRFNDARILYVTQSERLVRQAYKDIRAFLPGWNITQFGGSRKDNTGTDMVICTVAMLWANREALTLQGWFRTFMVVCYDESHHVCTTTSTRIMMKLPAFFRFGASDTGREGDEAKAAKIQGLLGPVRYVVPVATYIHLDRSAKPTIYLVENKLWRGRFSEAELQAPPNTPAWALIGSDWRRGTYLGPVYERDENGQVVTRPVRELEDEIDEVERVTPEGDMEIVKKAKWKEVQRPVVLDGYHMIQLEGEPLSYDVDSRYCLLERMNDKAIVTFKERNNLIAEWIRYYAVEHQYPSIVVCTRTMHVLILETLIQRVVGVDKVRVLFSDHTSKQRDLAFDWFRQTPGAVLISPLIKEGVSINEIRAGVVADYVGDWEVFNQIIGRFIRKKKGQNEAFITAFIDVQHPVLRRGSRRMFNRLYNVRGYRFYHPCVGPETIDEAKEYGSLD